MNTATITSAQDKGLRYPLAELFSLVRGFSKQLFAAHGGWLAARQARIENTAAAAAEQRSRAELFSLAARAESYEPNLAAELRYLANR